MTTKTQLVDFIYSNFIFIHGVQVTISGLQKKSKEELEKIIQSTGTKRVFKEYLSSQTVKFLVDGIQNGEEYSWDCTSNSEKLARKSLEKEGIKITRIVPVKGHHRCKYCQGIAEGSNKNLLCSDCMVTFGHTYYSEL